MPLAGRGIPTGPVYPPIFAAYVFIISGVAWVNLSAGWLAEKRESTTPATGDAETHAPSRVEAPQFSKKTEFAMVKRGRDAFLGIIRWSIDQRDDGRQAGFPGRGFLLGAGMSIVAVAILKHNALIKKEKLERDAIYTSIGALGIAAVYVAALLIAKEAFWKRRSRL